MINKFIQKFFEDRSSTILIQKGNVLLHETTVQASCGVPEINEKIRIGNSNYRVAEIKRYYVDEKRLIWLIQVKDVE